MTSFLYNRGLNLVRSSIVSLWSYLEVCGDVVQFVRPICATGRMCIIQPDVVDVDTIRDVTINPKAGLGTSLYSTGSAYFVSIASVTTPMIFSHSITFMGSLSVILSSPALQMSTSDWAFLLCWG